MAFKMKGSPFQQMESNAQQRKNLMNDNPVDSKASALNKMDPMHNGEPGVQKEDFEQFSSPMNQGRKVKKAKKTQAQIDKIRKSFGTKDADVSGRFERKRKKMDKTVGQLEKKGVKVDFDTTSAEGEGKSRKTYYYSVPKKGSPMNQGGRKGKKARKTLKQIEEMQDKRQTKIRVNSKVNRIVDEGVISNKEKRKSRKLAKTMKQVMDSSPMNQGKKSKTKKFPKGDVRNRPGTKGPRHSLEQQQPIDLDFNKTPTSKVGKARVMQMEKLQMPIQPRRVMPTLNKQKESPMNQGEKKIPFIKKKNVIRTPRSKKKITKSKLEEERNTRKQNFRQENQITAKSLGPKDGKKKKSPLNNKEERRAKRAKRREETGGTRIGNAIRKGKEVVDKVKNSKVGKVASGIVKTVSNVKSGRIGAAIESGKQTISDAKKKKADSPATMKKSKY